MTRNDKIKSVRDDIVQFVFSTHELHDKCVF